MPHSAPPGKEVFYYPYWRFKGMLFSCLPRRIENRFFDVSHQAITSRHFPPNIGFRAQTQKLRFAAVQQEGVLLKPGVPFDHIFTRLREQYSPPPTDSMLHQEFIGETRSLIYAPFYFDSKLMDAVVNEPVSKVRREEMPEGLLQPEARRRPIDFLAALCPNCGGDLDGDSDCLVLTCRNCQSAWWEQKRRLAPLKTVHFPGEERSVYLPFWRVRADVTPVRLETYADLVKIANMPRVVQPGWDKIPFRFWNPAFKLRPQNYLTIATQMTLGQPMEKAVSGPPGGDAYSVNLPIREALESLKLILANFLRPLEARVDLVPQIEIKPHRFSLVYIPFKDTRLELVHPRLNLAVNKSVLSHARNL